VFAQYIVAVLAIFSSPEKKKNGGVFQLFSSYPAEEAPTSAPAQRAGSCSSSCAGRIIDRCAALFFGPTWCLSPPPCPSLSLSLSLSFQFRVVGICWATATCSSSLLLSLYLSLYLSLVSVMCTSKLCSWIVLLQELGETL